MLVPQAFKLHGNAYPISHLSEFGLSHYPHRAVGLTVLENNMLAKRERNLLYIYFAFDKILKLEVLICRYYNIYIYVIF